MKHNIINYTLLSISILTSLFIYKYLPDSVASHWNYLGQVDAYSPKQTQAILFPALLALMLLLLILMPRLDPLKKNIEKFNNEFQSFISSLMLFFVLIQYQTILWSFGYEISPNIFFPIIFGLLFFQIGGLLEKAKRNWTIGIRTPWTLSSDSVWEKTHKVGGKLAKYSLPIFFLSILFPSYSFIAVIGYVLGMTLFLFIYSYVLFHKEKN